jgi:hypothetical protein
VTLYEAEKVSGLANGQPFPSLGSCDNPVQNADGTFTVYFGSAETCSDVPNRLDTTGDWNFLMRIYRPGKSVLEGAYKLPAAKR